MSAGPIRLDVVMAFVYLDLDRVHATGEYVDIRDGLPMTTAEADLCRSATVAETQLAADAWSRVALGCEVDAIVAGCYRDEDGQ